MKKIIIAINFVALLFAQNGSISGTVTDADGNPLAGALKSKLLNFDFLKVGRK